MPQLSGPSHCHAVTAPELRQALGVALVQAREATVAWMRLGKLAFFPMSCGAQKLAHALTPYARRAGAAFAAQRREVLLMELGLFLLLLLAWRVRVLLRRRRYFTRLRAWSSARIGQPVGRRYTSFKEGVRRRSRIVARAIPHFGFALVCLLLLRAFGALGLDSVLLPAWAPLSWLLLTPVPWIRTLLSLRSDGTGERSLQRDWLRYWVLWATFRLAAGAIAAIPFASRFLPTIALDSPAMAPMVACVAAWVHLPHDGLELGYGLVGPPLAVRAQRLADALPAFPAGILDKLALVLRFVAPSGVYAALMQGAQEGYILFGAAACLLTPYPLTGFALMYWSLCYPILVSIEALEMATASPDAVQEAAYATQVQLRYWLLHCALAAALQQLPWLLWLPFSTHAQMMLAVWLQLPYFRAASLVMLQLMPVGRALLRVTSGGAAGDTRLLAAGSDATPSGTPSKAAPGEGRHARSPRANAIYSTRLQQQPGPGTPDGHQHQE